MEPFQGKQYVSLSEVAHWLDLSPNTVRKQIRDGKFPKPELVFGVIKFNTDDLRAWLAAKKLGLVMDPKDHEKKVKPDPEGQPQKKK